MARSELQKVWRGTFIKSGFAWTFVAEGCSPVDGSESPLSLTGFDFLIWKRSCLIRRRISGIVIMLVFIQLQRPRIRLTLPALSLVPVAASPLVFV
jgi:hypothetical protein